VTVNHLGSNSEHGLSTHFVPSRRLPSLLDRLSALEDPSPKIIDQTLNEFSSDLGDKWESPLTGATRVALDSCFSHDTVEEIIKSLNSVIEKEGGNPDLVGWAKSTLKELELRSPTSLKVSLEAIRRGKNMTLDEALRMEMRIASAFCVRHFNFLIAPVNVHCVHQLSFLSG
jgi:3-hydroxyisobutyryl-CoA hydrolase